MIYVTDYFYSTLIPASVRNYIEETQSPFSFTRYHAPELFVSQNESTSLYALDVYSFGIMMWEILCAKPAYKNKRYYAIIKKVLEKKRPSLEALPIDCETSTKDLVVLCWAQKSIDRPTFNQIYNRLEQMSKREEDLL